MNLNNFTIKAQEVVAAAQQLAYNRKHQFIDTIHLLKAMLENENGSTIFILKKNDVNVGHLQNKLNEMLDKMGSISGEPAQMISQALNSVVLKIQNR